MTFLDKTRGETDRGRALVAASVIEEMLEEVLKAFLLENSATKKLFESGNAPLSTFSAKCSMSRALGLISAEEYRDIEFVRKIRNAFAHSILTSFEDNQIVSWAMAMKVGVAELEAPNETSEVALDDPRERFSLVTTSLVLNFYNRAHFVKSKRLTEQDWPL